MCGTHPGQSGSPQKNMEAQDISLWFSLLDYCTAHYILVNGFQGSLVIGKSRYIGSLLLCKIIKLSPTLMSVS